jgi:type VI secretion system protein ImpB
MAGKESIHKKLERVRKPHVHITYEVYTGDAMEVKELPFVMGIMGDYAGDTKMKPLNQRKFLEIDRDNINDVMKRIGPTLNFRAENTLAGDGSEMAVSLKFESMKDFEPGRVVDQVPALKQLLDVRNKLRDLASTAEKIDGAEDLLAEILKDADKVKTIAGQKEGS